MPMTTAEARAAADRSWALTPDRSARTAPARAAFASRFKDDAEKSAHYREMARRSAESRRRASPSETAEVNDLLGRVADGVFG